MGDAQHLTDSWWELQLGILFSSPEITLTNLRGDFDRMIIKQTLFFNCQGKLPGHFRGSLCQCNSISFPIFLAFFFSLLSFQGGWSASRTARGTDDCSLIRCFLRKQFLLCSLQHSEQAGDESVLPKPADLLCVGSDFQRGNMSWACWDVPSQVFSLLVGHPEDLIHDGNLR